MMISGLMMWNKLKKSNHNLNHKKVMALKCNQNRNPKFKMTTKMRMNLSIGIINLSNLQLQKADLVHDFSY